MTTSGRPQAKPRSRARHGDHGTRRVTSLTGLAALALMIPLAQAASAGGHSAVMVKKANRGSLGAILVTSHGAALYRFASDGPNKPTVTGGLLAAWPPLLMPAGSKSPRGGNGVSGLGTVKLPDGKRQVTYHKMPLYTFVSDSGTAVTGQGVSNFFVVHPSKAAGTARTTTPTASSSGGGYGY